MLFLSPTLLLKWWGKSVAPWNFNLMIKNSISTHFINPSPSKYKKPSQEPSYAGSGKYAHKYFYLWVILWSLGNSGKSEGKFKWFLSESGSLYGREIIWSKLVNKVPLWVFCQGNVSTFWEEDTALFCCNVSGIGESAGESPSVTFHTSETSF